MDGDVTGADAASSSGPEQAEETSRDPDKGPERTCIVTRVKGPPDAFLRFVVSPDGAVVPDLRRSLPGRGAWVTAEKAVVAEAVKRRSFARAFKMQVEVIPTLADMVDALLEKDALQALAMANKAGLVVAGAGKVEGLGGSQSAGSPGSCERRQPRRNPQSGSFGSPAPRRRGRCHRPHPNLSFRPIGFGIGAHKCDTRCGGRGNGRRRVCVAIAETGSLPRESAGGSRGFETIYRGLSETRAGDRLRRSQVLATDTALGRLTNE